MYLWSTQQLQALIDLLRARDYDVIGPAVRDDSLHYERIDSLPVGWGDRQDAGHYQLRERADQSRFGYNLGAATWKQFLFPPRETLFRVRDGDFVNCREAPQKMAFLGVRPCELAAIALQDRVFTEDPVEPGYLARRKDLLLIAVNCSQAAPTCFCASTGDGPEVNAELPTDLVLTECEPADPYYLVEALTQRGQDLLEEVGGSQAPASARQTVDRLMDATREQLTRALDTEELPGLLLGALDHPHWDDLAQRCLACGNCTQVCPTCFCSTAEDHTDPITVEVRHNRRWDSCFTQGHSYLTGSVVHRSVRSRYRQWLTHKLASWVAQFGRSGCTGCGRCITWCPVAIDLTVETEALRAAP